MSVSGIYRQGSVKLNELPDWADDVEVQVSLKCEPSGISEGEQGTDPESIARWIEWYDSFEPVTITQEEEERMEAAIRELDEVSMAFHQDLEIQTP